MVLSLKANAAISSTVLPPTKREREKHLFGSGLRDSQTEKGEKKRQSQSRRRSQMGAAAAGDDEVSAAVAGKEERILVSVRVRPLNAKEFEKGDTSDWDCVNDTTIVFKYPPPGERALFPTNYRFDRVFGKDIGTRQVYEEGAKEVALSVVRGINSSIFAYGQTSSGKTYTMTGITEYSVADIYQYIKKHAEREFTLKFSAMEIYNEAVRDLLSADSTPLRLLDDPEKGTIVEKLIEETLRDQDHLRGLLSMCEAQRQIGETNLNEMSSRSHQILRLTIESSNKVYVGRNTSTLVACVNFVDLAGSERASQAMSAGMRLKEGCHINRSLLTLGTVIRKLSKGGRNGHVPYRDSKLTRILQPALGGNARTAIICTMSPAHSHVEQSRNTLLFASCAKEVVTNARVNLVMSDKALIKHLQHELTRLETELRYTGSASGLGDCASHAEKLKEKDAKIRKLENDLRDLMLERDHAQSRLDDLLRSARDEPSSRQWDELSRTSGTHAHSPSSEVFSNSDTFAPIEDREYGFTLSENPIMADSDIEGCHSRQPSSPGSYNLGFHKSPERGFAPLSDLYEEHCKEVQCVEINNLVSRTQSENVSILLPEDTNNLLLLTDADKLESHEVSSSDDSELPVKVDQELKNVSMTKMVDIFAEPEPQLKSSIDSVLYDGADHKTLGFSKRVDDDFAEPDLRVVHSDSCTDLQHEVDQKSLSFAKRVDQAYVTPESPYEADEEADKSIVKKVDSFSEPESKVKVSIDQELPENTDQEKNNVINKAMARFAKLSADVTPLFTPPSGNLTRSRSCRASLMLTSAYLFEDLQNRDKMTPPDSFYKDFEVRPERVRRSLYTQNSENMQDRLSVIRSHGSERFVPDKVEGEKQDAQGQSEKQIDQTRRAMSEDMSVINNVPKGASGFDPTALGPITGSPTRWTLEFVKKQQEIIELWHVCNVSLVHRTHFFLLFNGDPADAIYMEVELRRLSFLKNNFSTGGSNIVTTSVKTLKREREMLYRQMLKKLNTQERENVYTKWGIVLSSKQRRFQLARLVWTKTDLEHVTESASLVADLIGLSEPGQALKQMVELSFTVTPPRVSRLSFSFKGGSFD